MIKLLTLLFLISAPVPAPEPNQYTWEQGTDYAGMCHKFGNGFMECQESLADDVHEVCWCSIVDSSWVYCGCLQPHMMSKGEWLEYLIYRGRPNQVEI